MAAPFVQGRLRREALSVEIASQCGHCGDPLHLTVASDPARGAGELTWRSGDPESGLLVFEPAIDWEGFSGPNIIDAY